MSIRPVGLVRVGLRRLGSSSSGGLPFVSPLIANAVLYVNAAGTKATTNAGLLFEESDGTLAVLLDGTSYTPITDKAGLIVKKNSGSVSAILDGGGASPNLVQLRNGGGGSRDSITSSNLGGFQVGTNAGGGFNNSGITMDPGNVGFSALTLDSDNVFVAPSGKVSFFNSTPVGQRTRVGTIPAGATYNANTQNLLNDCINTLRALGLLS